LYLIAISINHHTAPVEIREKLAFGKTGLAAAVQDLKKIEAALKGFVVLSTCNRTEIYAAVDRVSIGLDGLRRYLQEKGSLNDDEAARYLQTHTCYEAINHLFRVASGLDSLVLGETEILGQVKAAYETACEMKTVNSILNTFFQEAIRVGKKVRTITRIDQHPASVSYAAVELARQALGSLCGRTVLIIGAGEMGELTLKHLLAYGVSAVLVSNRSYERAEVLAGLYGGEAIRFDKLFSYLSRADIVISCTSATHYVVGVEQISQAMMGQEEKKMFIIDIAVPRDVEPRVADIPGVILYDIDDLQQVVLKFMKEREKAAQAAEQIIKDAVDDFLKWLGTLSVIPTIKALQDKGQAIKQAELYNCLNRLGTIDFRTEKLIRGLANTLVKKLLHSPIVRLKEYAGGEDGHLYSRVLCNLFDLQPENEDLEMKMRTSGNEQELKLVAQGSEGTR